MSDDFIASYLDYTAKTECPLFFHRWCAITSLSAYLGRRTWMNHGHFTLYPNFYTLLIGTPGTKKSSAIKIVAKLLKDAGYDTFAAKKTRQEKFLLDLSGQEEESKDILDENLWGDIETDSKECFVAADEFNNFIGISNVDFISILGELWDYEGVFDYRLKNSKSVRINNPAVSILGGNTPTGFSYAFPPEIIGQGFFSRLILVYSEPTGVKYTFPPVPCELAKANLISILHRIRTEMIGEVSISEDAAVFIDKIYHEWKGVPDVRFEHYANRRLPHLLKLCLVLAASKLSMEISYDIVMEANTILTYTEQLMPKALGEFGQARNSASAHKVLSVIEGVRMPIPLVEIWKAVHQDFESRTQLVEILGNLTVAEKVQATKAGYLPVRRQLTELYTNLLDLNYLSTEERRLL